MKYGMFMMPSHPPERELYTAHQWDLDCLHMADELGFSEAWIGEPYQKPHPPIGVASVSIGSETLKIAGERGFIPMSLAFNQDYVISHWDAIAEGAARGGRIPKRSDWRITRDVWVADSDDEAMDGAVNRMLGRVWGDYLLPLSPAFGLTHVIKHDSSVPDEAVTPEYMAGHVWLVGSPDTVEKRLLSFHGCAAGSGRCSP